MLSGGVDPDSLVAGGGAALLREAVERAQGGIEFFAFEVWGKARANADARARALEDAARLVGKIANPVKRDLIVGTLATAMDVDVGVVRNALTRGFGPHQTPAHHPAQHPRPQQHPNAPSSQREDAAPATPKSVAPPPMDELELIALLADHPVLIATDEADKAFWLLTDGRLRDMYSAARDGHSLLELAPVRLPPTTAKHVLSGKYTAAKDPASSLAAMTRNLEARKVGVDLVELRKSLADAKRRGDHGLARELAQRAVAERRGNPELDTKLAAERKAGSKTENNASPVDPETSNRKQVE
jgi:DNA primase